MQLQLILGTSTTEIEALRQRTMNPKHPVIEKSRENPMESGFAGLPLRPI